MVEFEHPGSAGGTAYDPDQDAAEKRDIRKKYRLLEKKTGGAYAPCSPKRAMKST
jgi:hypothetical protein